MLVLQGGGSLGAYECGVYKGLYKNGIEFDVLAGSSIGAVNTAVITAAQNAGKNAADTLENFWLSLCYNNITDDPKIPLPFITSDKIVAILSSLQSIYYGVPKAFLPKWFMPNSQHYYLPYIWTYLYDTDPLKKTLKKSIGLEKINKIENNTNNYNKKEKRQSRLIITSTDIQRGEPVIFDNAHIDIYTDDVIACIGYPFYGIKWSMKNGKYLWDGSLLTNTPMMEVIRASPIKNKKFYIVDVFPRHQKEIPENMVEVWHRARDIIFMDKTDKNIEKLKITEKYINLLKKMYKIIKSNDSKASQEVQKLKEIDDEYRDLTQKHGAAITDVVRISRKEKSEHYLFEDTDFSVYRIEKLIQEGERDAKEAIENDQDK